MENNGIRITRRLNFDPAICSSKAEYRHHHYGNHYPLDKKNQNQLNHQEESDSTI